jgi:hypothetical protein
MLECFYFCIIFNYIWLNVFIFWMTTTLVTTKKFNNKTLCFLLLNKVVCLFCLSNHGTFDYVLGNVIKLSTSRGAPRCFHIV